MIQIDVTKAPTRQKPTYNRQAVCKWGIPAGLFAVSLSLLCLSLFLTDDDDESAAYPYFWASQVALVVKNPHADAGDIRDPDSIPGSGRSHIYVWFGIPK